MRITTASAAAVCFVLGMPREPPDLLMTVPQADEWRSTKTPASAAVSADGRYVALASYARLVPADTDDRADIYVLDRLGGGLTIESLTADGHALDGDCSHPRLSGDGRYLVYRTTVAAGDGAAPDTDIVVRDRTLGTATFVGRDAGHVRPAYSDRPGVSADGRIVVFESGATDLVAGADANGAQNDVYTFDVATRALRRVSVDSRGVQRSGGASFAASVSGDGRYVAFTSTADLDGVPAGGLSDSRQVPPKPIAQVYVHDMVRGVTARVSAGGAGVTLDGASYDAAISRDGHFVAFVSEASNLAPNDRNRSADVFVRDVDERSTFLVSRGANGGTANGPSGSPAMAGDGRLVAFQSEASDLVCARRCPAALEDLNLLGDVFLFDRATARMTWISAGASGWAEPSGAPQMDAAGTIVSFTSRHPIDERDVRNDFDLFIRIRK